MTVTNITYLLTREILSQINLKYFIAGQGSEFFTRIWKSLGKWDYVIISNQNFNKLYLRGFSSRIGSEANKERKQPMTYTYCYFCNKSSALSLFWLFRILNLTNKVHWTICTKLTEIYLANVLSKCGEGWLYGRLCLAGLWSPVFNYYTPFSEIIVSV